MRNAIIMAAGLSSRFAPLSYEKPKGLYVVRGEVLIERQILQLQEAGIADITIVVGYKKEMFFYLEEKFNVRIVINEDYYKYNNTSSLIRVLDLIDNTYICSSDNYFTENVFLQDLHDCNNEAYYSACYCKGKTSEWCIEEDGTGIINKVSIGGSDSWYMLGHVYFNHDFSISFKTILAKEYESNPTCRQNLWEHLYMQHLDILHLHLKRFQNGIIHEFDSLEELRGFDPEYINNTDSSILKNICNVLGCCQNDISDIHTIKQGLTNNSFYFANLSDGIQYVYRHPGVGTSSYINRKSEAISMKYAKYLGLDNTFVFMNANEGWKISKYINNAHTLDYHNHSEVQEAISLMRRLHAANIQSEFRFGIWDRTMDFVNIILDRGCADFEDFRELLGRMGELHNYTLSDNVEEHLCHCDCYDPNFLIDENGNMSLIDWEYSGNDDPGVDIGTFICCSDYNEQEADDILKMFIGHELDERDRRHYYAYISIASYYWYVWAIYQNSKGNDVGDYLYLWYKMARTYLKKSIEIYEK